MKIVYVLDQFDQENNGTTISASRFISRLRERGHEVRVISTGQPAPFKYVVPSAHFGIFEPLISSQGMKFARPDEKVIREAIKDADIVHMMLPFKLCMKTRRIAQEMGIAHIAAFHTQAENITYNIGMKHFTLLRDLIYIWFYRRFYRYVRHIQCPSKFMAKELKKRGYRAQFHVISNGVDEVFHPRAVEKPPEWKDKFVIMMVGRLSEEKRQDLIIKAVQKSKYKESIQLVFLGKGPRQKYYERLGRKLPNKPEFKYVSKEELAVLFNQCDLYVHASEAESEAIACNEAITSGLVPVISDSGHSAASQFAIDGRSLFKNKNHKDLKEKIEYWIEHPEEKKQMGEKYADHAKGYSLNDSVLKFERLYRNVIREQQPKKVREDDMNRHVVHMPTPFVYEVDEEYRFINRNIFFKIGSLLVFYVIGIPLLSIGARLFFGLRIKGKTNFSYLKGGAVTVTNHVHMLDSPMVACTLFPRKPFFASLKSNFEIPVVRWLVRLLGGVPIPETPKALHAFMNSMREELQKGRIVHFYPEASLWPWYEGLRPFKDGAFHLAVKSNVPVLPMVFKFRDPWWPSSYIRKTPLVTMIIGKPQYPDENVNEKERIENMREAVSVTMNKMLNEGKKRRKRNVS